MTDYENEQALRDLERAVCLAADIRRDLDKGEELTHLIRALFRAFLSQTPYVVLMNCVLGLVELARHLSVAETLAHPEECQHPGPDGETDGEFYVIPGQDADGQRGREIYTSAMTVSLERPDAAKAAAWDQVAMENINLLIKSLPAIREDTKHMSDGEALAWNRQTMVQEFIANGDLAQQLLTHAAMGQLVLRKIPQHVIELYLVGDPQGVLPKP
jgi:hypothetical protein